MYVTTSLVSFVSITFTFVICLWTRLLLPLHEEFSYALFVCAILIRVHGSWLYRVLILCVQQMECDISCMSSCASLECGYLVCTIRLWHYLMQRLYLILHFIVYIVPVASS